MYGVETGLGKSLPVTYCKYKYISIEGFWHHLAHLRYSISHNIFDAALSSCRGAEPYARCMNSPNSASAKTRHDAFTASTTSESCWSSVGKWRGFKLHGSNADTSTLRGREGMALARQLDMALWASQLKNLSCISVSRIV